MRRSMNMDPKAILEKNSVSIVWNRHCFFRLSRCIHDLSRMINWGEEMKNLYSARKVNIRVEWCVLGWFKKDVSREYTIYLSQMNKSICRRLFVNFFRMRDCANHPQQHQTSHYFFNENLFHNINSVQLPLSNSNQFQLAWRIFPRKQFWRNCSKVERL